MLVGHAKRSGPVVSKTRAIFEPLETRQMFAATLTLNGVTPNATISGNISLQATINPSTDVPAVSSVRYMLSGAVLSTPLPYGTNLDWSTVRVWDGPVVFQAVALSADGQTVATSDPVSVVIDNGPGDIQVRSLDVTQTQRGVISATVDAHLNLTQAQLDWRRARGISDDSSSIGFVLCYVDGKQTAATYNLERSTFQLDTTRLANGVHDLLFTAYGRVEGDPPVAMQRVQINVDNGRTLRDVRPAYSELFLAPAQTASLAPRQVFTDDTTAPADASTFVSADPRVATIDAAGLVRAISTGTTTITTNSAGFTQTTSVTVRSTGSFTHLSKDGQTLTSYDPARSTFVRSMFNLGVDQITNTPGLAGAVRSAGINALTNGFYQNPIYTGSADLASWKRGYDQWWGRIETTAKQQGFNLVLIGDELARTAAELNNSINNAWADDAIQYALAKARDSGIATSIEMVDETDYQWGDTPTPTDGRWGNKSTPLPNDAISRLMTIMNAVPNRPSVTWPVAGRWGDTAARNWMGNRAFSDHSTVYWDLKQRPASPLGASVTQFGEDLASFVQSRSAVVGNDVPMIVETSATGIYYRTRSGGGVYKPGVDEQIAPGVGPVQVAQQIMEALTLGASGVRVYGYDDWWKSERSVAQNNGKELQTGTDPFGVGPRRWAAMSAAFNTIAQIEEHVLQPKMNAIDLGDKFVTGARQGPNSRVLMAVNNSDATQHPSIDLSPYAYAGGTVTMYRVSGKQASSAQVSLADASNVDFAAGQAVVWVFEPAPPPTTLPVPTLLPASRPTFYGPYLPGTEPWAETLFGQTAITESVLR